MSREEEIAEARHNALMAWEDWQVHEERMNEARGEARKWEDWAEWLRTH